MKIGLNVDSSTVDLDQKKSLPEHAQSDLNILMIAAVICLITIVGHYELRGPYVCKVFNGIANCLSAMVIVTQTAMNVVKLPKWVQVACRDTLCFDVAFFLIALVTYAIAGTTN